jgi:hypothetical protein
LKKKRERKKRPVLYLNLAYSSCIMIIDIVIAIAGYGKRKGKEYIKWRNI